MLGPKEGVLQGRASQLPGRRQDVPTLGLHDDWLHWNVPIRHAPARKGLKICSKTRLGTGSEVAVAQTMVPKMAPRENENKDQHLRNPDALNSFEPHTCDVRSTYNSLLPDWMGHWGTRRISNQAQAVPRLSGIVTRLDRSSCEWIAKP